MDPVMLQLGPLVLRWYGFLIALGVLIGSHRRQYEARKRGLSTDNTASVRLRLEGDAVAVQTVTSFRSPAAAGARLSPELWAARTAVGVR